MATYLVTGSARGIGHELVQQLAAKPDTEINTIFATSRAENARLNALTEQHPGRVIFVPLTVGDETSMRNAVPIVETVLKVKGLKGLDVLINNAGVVGSAYAKEMYSASLLCLYKYDLTNILLGLTWMRLSISMLLALIP